MSESQGHGIPSLWERGAARTIAPTRVFDLCGITYRHPKRGNEREFICLKAPDWVNVVAVTDDGRLVLVRQFRFGSNALSLEVPGGVMEVGEDPVAAGQRELAEETGFTGGKACLLTTLHPNPAIMDNHSHIVLVEGVSHTQANDWDADEEIEVSLVPCSEALGWLREGGRITHSLSVCALLLYAQARGVQARV